MTAKQHICIFVFLHNDLEGLSKDQLYDDHFDWLKKELELISERTIEFLLIDDAEAAILTAFNYKNEDTSTTLQTWKWLLIDYVQKQYDRPHYTLPHYKFLLLTRDALSSKVAGRAEIKGQVGIASIKAYQIPGHEIGHMLGATHEDSATIYNGWWYETTMSSPDLGTGFRGKAYRYSDKNREHIRKYLANFT